MRLILEGFANLSMQEMYMKFALAGRSVLTRRFFPNIATVIQETIRCILNESRVDITG